MEKKASQLLIRIEDLDLRAALILKQDMLSLGGDVALKSEAAGLEVKSTPAIIMGTPIHLTRLIGKIKSQPFGLSDLADSLDDLLRNYGSARKFVVNGRDLLGKRKTLVMGVLNITDDSFSDGGHYLDREAAVERGIQMIGEGADIVDVGGESTRPGALQVSPETEISRVVPIIEELAGRGCQYISIDTTKAEVAERALASGASIVNDISAMNFDSEMATTASAAGASVILMHTAGRPETMQDEISYDDLMADIFRYLSEAVKKAEEKGISRERLCVDPGIGFGKTPEHNMELIARVVELRSLGTSVLIGASRKSFLGHYLGNDVQDRLTGSIAAAAAAIMGGADIVRVHDVAQTVKAATICDQVKRWTN
jgi:dihydropteroate synthase